MKTYLLTEKDVELLREEFCISKLQSDTLNEMISKWGWVSHNEHTIVKIECKDPNYSKTKGIYHQIGENKPKEDYKGNITPEDIKKLTEWVSGAKVIKKEK